MIPRRFCDEPLNVHVARLAMLLGFDDAAIARWQDLPDPPTAAPRAAEPVFESSA